MGKYVFKANTRHKNSGHQQCSNRYVFARREANYPKLEVTWPEIF